MTDVILAVMAFHANLPWARGGFLGVDVFFVLSGFLITTILLDEWRSNKIRGSTHDLRMAASCVVGSATLVTRNGRDFEHIPGLAVEFWE